MIMYDPDKDDNIEMEDAEAEEEKEDELMELVEVEDGHEYDERKEEKITKTPHPYIHEFVEAQNAMTQELADKYPGAFFHVFEDGLVCVHSFVCGRASKHKLAVPLEQIRVAVCFALNILSVRFVGGLIQLCFLRLADASCHVETSTLI